MNHPRKLSFSLLAALLVVSGSPLARADDAAAAQALFDQAKKAMAEHKFAEACPKLEESYRLDQALGTLLNLADCYERDGKLATAWGKFLEVASKARAAGQTQRSHIARDRAAALVPKLASVVIDVPAASRVDGLEVRRDGSASGEASWGTAIPVDPGSHTIEASAPGMKPWSQSVDVPNAGPGVHVTVPALERLPVAHDAPPGGASEPASPTPEPLRERPIEPASDKPSGLKIAAIATGAAGVVGLGVGGVTGLLSLLKHNQANGDCPSNPCMSPKGVDEHNEAFSLGTISTVAFAVGGAVLATGVVLWFVAPKSGEMSSARLMVGPTNVALQGAW